MRAIHTSCIVLALLLASIGCSDPEDGPVGGDLGETPSDPPTPPPPPPQNDPPEEPADEPDDGLFACTWDEISPIFECALDQCLDLDFDPTQFDPSQGMPDLTDLVGDFDVGKLALCVGVSCFPEILSVSPECRDCLLAGIGSIDGDFEGAAEACTDLDLGGLGGGGGLPF